MSDRLSAAGWATAQLAGWGYHVPVSASDGDRVRDWLESGVPALTGRPDRQSLVPPGAAATAALGCEAAFAALTGAAADRTWHQMLAMRAGLTGWQRRGPWSLGGTCRAVRCSDGFVALNLARPDDVASVAAVVGHDRVVDDGAEAWLLLDDWAAGTSTDAAADQLRLLDIPSGRVPPAGAWWNDSVARAGVAGEPVVRSDIADGPAGAAAPLVVDLSALWAGPLCTMLLGRAGAKVVKVEVAGRPDGARAGNREFYEFLHTGKESLLVDLNDAQDHEMLQRLIARADIVVESSRPRALQRWGIDAHAVCSAGLTTWVSITAYGRRFPDRVGFGDDVAMASGLAAREADDDWPLPCGDAIADPLTGMHAAVHALSSYRIGGSRVLDIAMSEVVASTVAWSSDFGSLA